MIHVRTAPDVHLPWLFDRVGCAPTQYFRGLEAIDERDGRILAMVGYDNWTDGCVEMHFAVESPIAIRSLVYPAFDFPFRQEKRLVVIGKVRASNKRAAKLDRHLGFREVYRLKDGAEKGDDILLFEMRREECRWLRSEARKAA